MATHTASASWKPLWPNTPWCKAYNKGQRNASYIHHWKSLSFKRYCRRPDGHTTSFVTIDRNVAQSESPPANTTYSDWFLSKWYKELLVGHGHLLAAMMPLCILIVYDSQCPPVWQLDFVDSVATCTWMIVPRCCSLAFFPGCDEGLQCGGGF